MRFRTRVLHLENTVDSRREITRTKADETGVAKMTDKALGYAIRAEGLKSPGANILKQEALSVGAEAAVARGVVNCSTEFTDVVIMGSRKQLKRLITKLKPQPFGLKTLAAELASALDLCEAPQRWSFGGRCYDLEAKPLVMGIVNVTPDSFSDGGDHRATGTAVEAALRMEAEGADILDIGGESTRPGAQAVSLEDELDRVLPVISALSGRVKVPISIDTYKAQVALRAMEAGASVVNDISGLFLDPEMAGVVASTGAGLVAMHMRGTPRDMQTDTAYADIVSEVFGHLAQSLTRAREAGIDAERIVVDPGIGFAKSTQGNMVLLRRLSEFAALGRPVLVGASRKAFIGRTLGITEPKERLEGSLAVAALAVANGARIIRSHDVLATRRTVDMAWAIARAQED